MGRRSIAMGTVGTIVTLGALAGVGGMVVGGTQERTAPLPVSAAPASVAAAPATLEMFMYSTPGASDDLVVS